MSLDGVRGDVIRSHATPPFESADSPNGAFRHAFGESPKSVGRKFRRRLERGKLRALGIPSANLDYDRSEPKAGSVNR